MYENVHPSLALVLLFVRTEVKNYAGNLIRNFSHQSHKLESLRREDLKVCVHRKFNNYNIEIIFRLKILF